MDVMIEANETLQLQTIGPDDVRIDVEMGDDHHRGLRARARDDSAGRGRDARAWRRRSQRYAVPEAQYAAWRNR